MSRFTHLILLAWILLSVSYAGAVNYVDSQVVCRVLPGVDADTVAASVGALVADEIEQLGICLFKYRNPVPVDTVIYQLEQLPEVHYAQPNYIIRINLDQVSQPFVDQTSQPFVDGIAPLTYYDQYADNNMTIDSTHLINDGTGQVIAIIDGGVDERHPLFKNRLHPASFDFLDMDDQPWGLDGTIANHGTFVAGIAARAATGAELMIIRTFSAAGTGNSYNIASGIYHAAKNGADVINMSFGMDFGDGAIVNAINYAYIEHGVVMTAAAGNSNLEFDRFPAKHPFVMSVAAVDENDIKAEFSNYDMTVDVTACGVDIYSALCGGDVWGWWSGTSFSTPFVSGLAALVKSIYPNADPGFITDRIMRSSDDIDYLNPSYSYVLGEGRINFIRTAYLEGDANGSGFVNVGDVVFIVNLVFRDGPAPIPPEAGDANCDGEDNIGDAVFIINYVFSDGPPPGCGY